MLICACLVANFNCDNYASSVFHEDFVLSSFSNVHCGVPSFAIVTAATQWLTGLEKCVSALLVHPVRYMLCSFTIHVTSSIVD